MAMAVMRAGGCGIALGPYIALRAQRAPNFFSIRSRV
jgi:hypothetical protein